MATQEALATLIHPMIHKCVENGFVMPLHLAMIGVNGAAAIARCTRQEGSTYNFEFRNTDAADLPLPVNIMVVDAHGGAERIEVDRNGLVRFAH